MRGVIPIFFTALILILLLTFDRRNLKLKNIIKYISLSLVFLFPSCSMLMDNDIPAVAERQTNFILQIKDKSNFMQSLFGTDNVRNAKVLLHSPALGNTYEFISDSSGTVTASGLLSGQYLISVERKMTESEIETITGTSASGYKLINKEVRNIELIAGNTTPILIRLDMQAGVTPILISEIYACGPPGAGLYYHDKYVEVYNQSDSVIYLDGIIVAVIYSSSYLGLNYRDDPQYIHSKSLWMFPGNGTDYPIQPGEFVVCAEDAIDHRINAANSVDLSGSRFEFYKDDAPDIDNPAVPNMIRIYQDSGNDWLIGGEKGGLAIAKFPADSLIPYNDEFLIPYTAVLDAVEYMKDPTRLDQKTVNPGLDAGSAGGIQFYTGKSMERKKVTSTPRIILRDENNSSFDFEIIPGPTPQYYHP